MDFKSGAELLEQCAVRGMTISEVMKQRECDLTGVSMEDMEARMKDVLAVMRDSATLPLREPVTSIGGLIGGESARMEERRRKGTSILSGVLGRAVIYAMAVLEVNTSMGLIVAAPTAGSSGIVPGLLLALQEEYGLVECPCQNRNGAGAANALVCAETALSGIRQLIPFDEMLEAMYAVGRGLPLELRETALGGCAATPSGCRMGCCVQKA